MSSATIEKKVDAVERPEAEKRIEEAAVRFDVLMKKIAPFVHPRRFRPVSTAGQWRRNA